MVGKLRAIEICAGAGGQALGLELAGFEHELAVELDEHAVNTLRLNRPNWRVVQGDVADPSVWHPSDFAASSSQDSIDLFAGGVPCPPFSVAGKQLGAHDERDLFAWAVEQTRVLRPRAVLLENVRGLSMPRFAGYRQHVLERFRDFGYIAEWRLLHASEFGVPQLRPRFVLVAMQPEDFKYFHWPVPQTNVPTVGETLFTLMGENGWEGAEQWAANAAAIGPTVVGGSKKHGGADLGPTRAKRAWAAIGVDAKGIADEAPSPGAMYGVGPRLTNAMVARIQGWNDDEYKWRFAGKKTSTYRQIGNAFPPPMARALGAQIAEALSRTVSPRQLTEVSPVDPVYLSLRDSENFVTAEDIARKVGFAITRTEIDRRISALFHDFEIETIQTDSGTGYKLLGFRAFVGQDDHRRHEYFMKNLSKIS